MSRSVDSLQEALFQRLHDASGGEARPGGRRIYLDRENFTLAAGTKRIATFPVGRFQAAALMSDPVGELIILSGFEIQAHVDLPHLSEIDVPPGLLLAALSDLGTQPHASPEEILNVLDAGTMEDAGRPFHSLDLVAPLFRKVRAWRVEPEAAGPDQFMANLLALCANDATSGADWVDHILRHELAVLSEQHIPGLPYEFLVRASLQPDPRNMFVALYRCLEATYAYTRAKKVAAELSIEHLEWHQVARVLGDVLSWHPRHDQALASILTLDAIDRMDLELICSALGSSPSDPSELPLRASSLVRELRHSLVHYIPANKAPSEPRDWNKACAPMARIVGCAFVATYGVSR